MQESIIFAVIIVARLLIPLLIPKFPLPAIIAALIIDAADQTTLAAFDAEPDNYQQFDKAFDIYYLAVAYLSTIRNWTDGFAFRIAQFLWYYRLLGVCLFELTLERSLLLIFPNTFEFFFIFYEVVRVFWEPASLPRRVVAGAAAGIWVFIKLPQEFWIHVLQLDATEVVADNPWILVVLAIVGVIAAIYLNRWSQMLPPADWKPGFDVDAHPTTVIAEPADPPKNMWALLNHPLFEKTVLLGLIIAIFLQLADGTDAGVIETILGVGFIIVVSSYIEHWLAIRAASWRHSPSALICTGAINAAILLAFGLLPLEAIDDDGGTLFTWFLWALLSLIVTLYDRYRNLRLMSFAKRPVEDGRTSIPTT